MLISFALENFKSFKGRAELSLIPKRSDKTIRSSLIDAPLPGFKPKKLLAAAAIYGPNASGKTNFLLGLRTFKQAVERSQADWKPHSAIPVDGYVGSEDPTVFEIQFATDGTRYRYGFKANRRAFIDEWLYYYPKGRERLLFKRETVDHSKSYELTVELGASLIGPKRDHDATLRRTRHNSLFLSAAAQDNQEQCLSVYEWIAKKLSDKTTIDIRDIETSLTSILANDFPSFKALLTPVMKMADPSISEILVKRLADDPDEHTNNLPDRAKRYTVAFKLKHGKNVCEMPHEKESRGVKRLYSFAAQLITALKYGHVLFVDELETSMHTQVASQILALFQSKASNPHGAQLIFTTHETRLLNLQHLRRDQIWFCDKKGLESTLYSLLEFSPRKDENFELGYLRGRYGAVPQAALDPAWIMAINESEDDDVLVAESAD